MTRSAQQDESAVAAVRRGDAERYRELVERHERRVYAVAWSRLGDATLAEDATQEAFIRAYRRLWLLGDGAKFAGWVNTIARRIAINFGLRHRRELNKRKRWALEHADDTGREPSADEADPLYTPETLRQTLAELPDAPRECLVLFYLEGKSGAEAAAALGISESALRVRLHRARAAMRERLEDKLEGSLARLRPGKTLVPAVMAGVLASSSAKAATAGGAGAAVAAALAKLGLTKWLFPFAWLLSCVFVLPMLLVSWRLARLELDNFRDSSGFRARLYGAQSNRRILFVFIAMIAAVILARVSIIPANVPGVLGSHPLFLFLSVFSIPFLVFYARQMAVNRSPYFVAQTCASMGIAMFCLLVGLSLVPVSMVFILGLGPLLLTLPFYGQRPIRMDYNLFLRATEGLLKNVTTELPATARPTRCGKGKLLAFARFLGSRWLVNNYRWVGDGIQLRLPPTGSLTSWGGWSWSWKHRSHIQLAWDGEVSAQLGETDRKALSRFHGETTISQAELEALVAAALSAAWRCYRESDFAAAELALGQRSEKEVFVKPPAKGGMAKVLWLLAIPQGLALVLFAAIHLPGCHEWLDGLKPVNISAAEVRAFLNDTTPNPDPGKFKFNSPGLALFTCLVLPPTNLFSPDALRALRNEVTGEGGFDALKQNPWRAQMIFNMPMLRRAVVDGWISWSDLGIQPADSAAALRSETNPLNRWDRFLSRGPAWSEVRKEGFSVMRIQSAGLEQLRFLRAVNCLDLTDGEKLIRQIASVQVLSATPPGQPPIHEWREVRGLFFTPSWPALQDTYFSLAALEILGGLDKIDREACIRGILRRHDGKGFFTSPDWGGFNEYHIDGSARDTIAAFESLRILGALDRVKDLGQWRFRPPRRGVAKGKLTWYDVEAWVCQQRLQNIVRQRKENPRTPIGSLLGFGQK
jgi:RNA polymerase sigma-70 factor (ECF subfamily)